MVEYIEREVSIVRACKAIQDDFIAFDVKEAIKAIPAADVREVVHGKWTRINYQPCGHDYQCSECYDLNDRASNYCPNCGAKMEVEHD